MSSDVSEKRETSSPAILEVSRRTPTMIDWVLWVDSNTTVDFLMGVIELMKVQAVQNA